MKGKKLGRTMLFVMVIFMLTMCTPLISWAIPDLELPYEAGATYTCTLGYNSDPYHHNNDAYALDFAGNECDTWNEPILTVAEGTVIETGYNTGYGNYVEIDHGDGYASKYGHLNTVSVEQYQHVYQGEKIGTMGDTGNVRGSNCGSHPGLHLHFVLYHNGAAVKPEPMSGHTNFVKGGLYTSLNNYNTMTNFNVGKYVNGYINPDSLVFAVTFYYNGGTEILGYPISEVYEYPRCNNPLTDPPGCITAPNYKLWVQDYEKYGHIYTLVENAYAQNPRFPYSGVAYPMHGRIRDYWEVNYLSLGAPVTNEYPETVNGKNYAVQWFEPTNNNFVGVAYWLNNDPNNPNDDYYDASSLALACTESMRNGYIYTNVGCPDGECGVGGDGTEGLLSTPDYTYVGAYVCDGWRYGEPTHDHYDKQPDVARTEFDVGETVHYLIKLEDVIVDHQFKTNTYKDGVLFTTNMTGVFDVGAGWEYSSDTPYLTNMQRGSYEIFVYVNIGNGFELMEVRQFTVGGPDYSFLGSYVSEGWDYGSPDYWDLQPINVKSVFNEEEAVQFLAKAGDIYVDHRWNMKLYKDGSLFWDHYDPWQYPSSMWEYSSTTPYLADAEPGDYSVEFWLETGAGTTMLEAKTFTVNGVGPESIPWFDYFANDNHGFTLEDHLGSANMYVSENEGIGGDRCLVIENTQAGQSYQVQAKKIGFNMSNATQYSHQIFVKADTPGTVYIALQRDVSPWDNLGMWHTINATTSWQEFTLNFTTTGNPNPEDIRYTIMAGEFTGRLLIDSIRITE